MPAGLHANRGNAYRCVETSSPTIAPTLISQASSGSAGSGGDDESFDLDWIVIVVVVLAVIIVIVLAVITMRKVDAVAASRGGVAFANPM